MSDARSASSSDLELARELSRRLAIDTRPTPRPARPASAGYVAFTPRRVQVPMPPPLLEPAVESERRHVPDPPIVSIEEGSACWDRLLEWCLDAFGGEAAFVMDAYGLVVAARGRLGPDAVQGIGARLMIALQHAEQMDLDAGEGVSRALAVELSAGWLNGLRVLIGEGEDALSLTVGVASRAPFRRDERLAVERAFAAAAPRG
jgi:hypothetical protein